MEGGTIKGSPCADEPAQRHRDLRISLLLGLVCLLVYNANLRSISAGDTYPARYLPFGIWRYHSVLLDPISTITAQGRSNPYWIVSGRGGHPISLYPVVLPVLVAPLYLPAVVYLHVRGWTDERLDRAARIMEKLTASLLAAASVALLYLLLRRRAPPRDALLLAVAFAFGTTTWVISGQALWQHGLAELLVIGALLLVTGPCTTPRVLAAGVLCGLIACNRPPDSILAAAIGVYGLWWARRLAPLLVAGAVLPAGLVLAYNLWAAGSIGGGYGLPGNATFFQHDLLPGIAGVLFSPTRGLFTFSPFLLLLLCCSLPSYWRPVMRDHGARGLTLALGIAATLQLLIYAKADWRAGDSWGPRWLTDLLPVLLWMLPPAVAALRGAGRLVFVLAIGAAIAIQAVGAFWYTGASDSAIFAVAAGPDQMKAAWDLRNTPFVAELRHARAPGDLALDARGNVDRMIVAGRDEATVRAAGEEILLEGWALAGDRSPWRVAVLLDGDLAGFTSTFFDRPDVSNALRQASPAGWRFAVRTAGLAPGGHLVAATLQDSDYGETHLLAQRRFRVLAAMPQAVRQETAPGEATPQAGRQQTAPGDATPHAVRQETAPAEATRGAGPGPNDDLAGSARRVAAILRERQQPAGYWLTSHTPVPRFENPQREMNTFLTAMMVDLLEPVAMAAGLGESLERARRHLAGQIEANGLVRYHGRPDAPTIPALGCGITPDADDTALVWRIAPGGPGGPGGSGGHRASLPAALATLAQYRTAEGLYRTWLAPREQYQCIDPADPNPADAGIQMHVLLLLAQVDPPAARALCGALGRAIAEDRIWVYYRQAPLVPLLRQADLRRAGCALRLPASRLRAAAPEQEVWIAACRLLQPYLSAGGHVLSADATMPGAGGTAISPEATMPGAAATLPGAAATLALLKSLAADDFSSIRRSPPLLYHNDLTASTPRFYWSTEFGYALWLRLYLEHARRH